MKKTDLHLLVDGRLDADERARVEEAVRADPTKARALSQLRATREIVAQAFQAPTDTNEDVDLWSGVEARLRAEDVAATNAEPLPWWHLMLQPIALGAAAAALLLTLGVWWWGLGPTGPDTPLSAQAPTVAPTAARGDAAPVPGVRRPALDTPARARKMVAIVDSFDVERGVVVVSRPEGNSKDPLVIWHLMPEEGTRGGDDGSYRL